MILLIIGAGITIMLTSVIGVVFMGRRAEMWIGERVSYLVAFASGVFLITGAMMAFEVFHLFAVNLWLGGFLIMAGYGSAHIFEYLLPESHHHHDPHDHGHHHGTKSAKKIIIGDAIHNIGDGIMITTAFLVSTSLGLAATISIMIHEMLQEISEFFVMKQAGYSTKKTLLINLAVSSSIFIGIVVAYLSVDTHFLEGMLLAISAGFFLHVVVHDLLPQQYHQKQRYGAVTHFGLLLVGIITMGLLSLFFTHAHDDDSIHHDSVSESAL